MKQDRAVAQKHGTKNKTLLEAAALTPVLEEHLFCKNDLQMIVENTKVCIGRLTIGRFSRSGANGARLPPPVYFHL